MISVLPLGQMGPWQKSQLGDSGSGLGDGGSGGRDWLAVRNHWLLTALQGALRTDTKDCMWVGKRTRAAMGLSRLVLPAWAERRLVASVELGVGICPSQYLHLL